jgi:hypothetical protein
VHAASFLPSLVPQQYQAQPLFAYAVYTPSEPDAASAPLAKSIYTSPDDTLSGYSFQTEYEGGGKSEVVFVTGPQANQLLQNSINIFRKTVSPEAERTDQPLNSNSTNSSTRTSSATPPTSNGPIASYNHVQLYPAHSFPFAGSAPPFQNLISSFAYSITNEIANSIKDTPENDGEAQESMIHGDTVISPAPDTSSEETQNVTSAQETAHQSPPEGNSISTTTTTTTTSTTTTTTTATTTIPTTTGSNREPSTSSETSTEEISEVSDLNITTVAPNEITETTSA